jgi:cytochrome c oxidase assembly protein subunit 15
MTPRTFARFAKAMLVITVAVIIWGAVVRATGSGAGCGSHWPTCNGVVVPLAPRLATVIEYVHRLTSGAAMLLSVALVFGARAAFPAGHRARVWALASFGVMLAEAALGAGIVLLGLVEHNQSLLRALYVSVHLANTMLLTAVMTATIWWARQPAGRRPPERSRGLAFSMGLMVVVAAIGGAVALGDTLFPSGSLGEGFAADLNASSHFLIRLRVFHPALAVAAALILIAQCRRDPTFRGLDGESLRTMLITLVLLQAGIGALNLLMLAPLPLQMAHLLGSNLLWIALVWSYLNGVARLSGHGGPE